jgi:hypothetical protein
MKSIILILLFCFVFSVIISCDNLNVNNDKSRPECALLAIVEGSQNAGNIYQFIYDIIGGKAKPFICQYLEIDSIQANGLSIEQIIDIYGEDKIINGIRTSSQKFYDKIIILTDSSAKFESFCKSIEQMSKNYILDIVIDLHGDSTGMLFSDGFYWSDEIRDSIKSVSKIRTIYQTVCFGSYLIDLWAKHDVCGINGAVGLNSLVLSSPQIFLDNWVKGETFQTCVEKAYLKEADSLRNLLRSDGVSINIEGYLFNGSQQIISGNNPQINFSSTCQNITINRGSSICDK